MEHTTGEQPANLTKKVLCIIPFYNRAHLLRDAIESVLQQTYPNIELVLVNDGSTDNYLKVIEPYLELSNVHFTTYEKNRGIAYARNKGLEYLIKLNCDYFTVHDSDDISDVTRFEKVISYFDNSTLGIKTQYIKTNLKNEILYENGTYTTRCGEGIAFFSKKAFELLGYFNSMVVGEDTDYWWRLETVVKLNPTYIYKEHKELLYFARVHDHNITKEHKKNYPTIWKQIREDIREMSKTGEFYRDRFN